MILKQEINLIKNPQLRKAVTECIKERARKIKILPASTSGKYHPPDERGPGGMIKHIRKVVWFVKGLKKEFLLSDDDFDCLLVASILHDISMVDIIEFDENGSTVVKNWDDYNNHPKLSAQIAAKHLVAEGVEWTDPTLIKIIDLINSHMSHWAPHCKQPFDRLELMLCMADFFTTREEVSIKLEVAEKS